jgi:hypothetical protein
LVTARLPYSLSQTDQGFLESLISASLVLQICFLLLNFEPHVGIVVSELDQFRVFKENLVIELLNRSFLLLQRSPILLYLLLPIDDLMSILVSYP